MSRERRRDAWSDVLIACRDERAGRSLQARARACVADTLGLPGKRPLRPARTALRRTALRASRALRDRQSSVLLRLLLAVDIDSASAIFVIEDKRAAKRSIWLLLRRAAILQKAVLMKDIIVIKIPESNQFSDPETKIIPPQSSGANISGTPTTCSPRCPPRRAPSTVENSPAG